MSKKIRKDFALGYLVKDNESPLLLVGILFILLGVISVIIGVVFFEPDTIRYILVLGGCGLAGLGGIFFLVLGTSVRIGEIYCFPDKLVINEKGKEKKVVMLSDTSELQVYIKSYEGQTSAQISAGFSVIPKMEEGNGNFVRFVCDGINHEYRFQIENGAMYNKFLHFTKSLKIDK